MSNFRQTPGGDYIFNLDEKLLYGGIEIYSAIELNRWLYADLQGTLGLARYNDAEGEARIFIDGQSRDPDQAHRKSEWIQPYIRLGVNLYHKNFPTSYFGQFNGDVTKEDLLGKAEDAWNKGHTFDSDTFFPGLSAGIKVIRLD